jgi:hypothetical protein
VRVSVAEDGALRVESRRAAARQLIGLAGGSPRPAVEELRAERRRAADGEAEDARERTRGDGVPPSV